MHEINLDAFPGVTFRCNSEKLEAVTDKEIVLLYTGMPIWNVYFFDLTGDGKPELCSTVSVGSGIIDNRIIIYDYAEGVSYELSDRMNYDFVLNMKNGKQFRSSECARGFLFIGRQYVCCILGAKCLFLFTFVNEPLAHL